MEAAQKFKVKPTSIGGRMASDAEKCAQTSGAGRLVRWEASKRGGMETFCIRLPFGVMSRKNSCIKLKAGKRLQTKRRGRQCAWEDEGWGKTMEVAAEQTPRREKLAYEGVYNRYVKRFLDICIAGILLLALWPLYFVVGAMIAVEDGFPVLYRAERGGYNGQPFRICKFRTMVKNADQIGGGTTALHDPRITRVGNFLRKTKLDEIPQIGQVFLGKMSLIGPRPELLKYVEQYQGEENDILKVRPGITDFSSIEFINLDEIIGEENADEMYERYVLEEKNALRIKYAHTVSLKTDIDIFFKTIYAVVKKVFGVLSKKPKDAALGRSWNT